MNATDFFIAGGALQINAGSYVARGADAELLECLRVGKFSYVLTTRQMGKSSLMVRTAAQLREEGCAVVIIDLTAIGQNLGVEQWYFSMLCHVGEKLDLEDEMEAYWDGNLRCAPLHRFMGALREVYLERKRKPLVIFVDEIDVVRSLRQFSADEFFAGIRECHNRRTEDPKLERLTFCLLGVATPSDLISDQRMTPFNIGQGINLGDFTDKDAAVLAGGLSPHRDTARILLQRVLWWTSGQPFLTQKLCAEVAKSDSHAPKDVDMACARIFLSADAQERDDNLHFVRDRLLRSELGRAALLDTYARVCRNERMADDHLNPVVNELRLSGIVRVVEGQLRPRNRIYSQVFNLKWVRENLPDAELLRQRAAFYRGARRVAGVAAAMVIIMSGLVFKAREAEKHAVLEGQRAEAAGLREKAAAADIKRASENATLAAEREQNAIKEQLREAERTKTAVKEQLREAERTKVAFSRLVETLSKVEALLESLTPLVGDKFGKLILERAEDVVRGVSNESSDDSRVVLGLAGLRRVCGRFYLRLGDAAAALKQAQQARFLTAAELEKNDPAKFADYYKQLHDCILLVGDAMVGGIAPETLRLKTDDEYTTSIASYLEGLDLAKKQSAINPGSVTWRRIYFADLNILGDMALLFDRKEESEANYQTALKVVDEYRGVSSATDDLNLIEASIRERLGTLLLGQKGRTSEARAEFDRSLKLRQSDSGDILPDDPELQSGLATVYNKLGLVFDRQGQWKDALDYYARSLVIRRKLCDLKRQRDWDRNLGFSLYNNAKALWMLKENQRALDLAKERLDIAEGFLEDYPGDISFQQDRDNGLYFYVELLLKIDDKELQDKPKALELAKQAVISTERRNPRFLALLAQALWSSKRPSEALLAAQEGSKLLPPERKLSDEEKLIAEDFAYIIQKSKAPPKGSRSR